MREKQDEKDRKMVRELASGQGSEATAQGDRRSSVMMTIPGMGKHLEKITKSRMAISKCLRKIL
jgi:hypothetical protein